MDRVLGVSTQLEAVGDRKRTAALGDPECIENSYVLFFFLTKTAN